MTDTAPTHCGHDPRYIVQAGEGTAYCALCELEALRAELAAVTARAERLEANGADLAGMASRYHRLSTNRSYAARRVAAYCRQQRKPK